MASVTDSPSGPRQRKKKAATTSSDSTPVASPKIPAKSTANDNQQNKLVHAPDSAGSAASFYQKLFRRITVGVTLISVFTAILLSDHLYVGLLVILIQTIAFKEVINVRHQSAHNKKKRMPGFFLFNYYLLFLSFFYFYAPTIALQLRHKFDAQHLATFLQYHGLISFAAYVVAFVGFVLSLQPGKYKQQFQQFAWTTFTLVVVVAQSTCVFNNIFDGLIWFLVPCCAIVFNDIMAFFCGLLFGRKIINRKFLSLSPNKTWEGFLGAAVWTVFFSYVLGGFLAQYSWFICPKTDYTIGIGQLDCVPNPVFMTQYFNLPEGISSFFRDILHMNVTKIAYVPFQLHAVWFGIFASFIAPFGGFFTSGLKRAYDVKDFDNLFPGHGGMTDRMDCQMLMNLCVFVHIKAFIGTQATAAVASVGQLADSFTALPVAQQQELYAKLARTIATAKAKI